MKYDISSEYTMSEHFGEYNCKDELGEQAGCIDGVIYVPCDGDWCPGLCDYGWECKCKCHKLAALSAKGS